MKNGLDKRSQSYEDLYRKWSWENLCSENDEILKKEDSYYSDGLPLFTNLPLTQENEKKLLAMIEHPEVFGLRRLFRLTSDRGSEIQKCRVMYGRFAFLGEKSAFINNEIYSIQKMDGKIDPAGMQNGHYLYRTTPLMASVMAGEWGIANKLLQDKDRGQISVTDIHYDVIKRVGSLTSEGEGKGNKSIRNHIEIIVNNRVSAGSALRICQVILESEHMPDKLRYKLFMRYYEGADGKGYQWFFWTFSCYILLERQWKDHFNMMQFEKGIVLLWNFCRKEPVKFRSFMDDKLFCDIFISYFFISQNQADTFSVTPIEKCLKVFYKFTGQGHMLMKRLLVYFNTPGGCFEIATEEKRERLRSLWKEVTGKEIVMDMDDMEACGWFYKMMKEKPAPMDAVGAVFWENSAAGKVILLADRFLPASCDERRIPEVGRFILEFGGTELFGISLKKNLILRKDVDDLISFAREKKLTEVIPMLILKKNGMWEVEE